MFGIEQAVDGHSEYAFSKTSDSAARASISGVVSR